MPADIRKVFPRNLTAQADYRISGNPVVTRPEDAVGNCFPGLEVDVRNLDRRFFPGLVFEFVAATDPGYPAQDPKQLGAQLSYVDLFGDPDLLPNTPKVQALNNQLNAFDSTGLWYIAWIEQNDKRIRMYWHKPAPTKDDPELREEKPSPLDGLFVWRLIRSLERGPVTIALERRDGTDTKEVVLQGWRREFTDPYTGVLNLAYQPGELLQSLCSPWTHDFRDCACHYWASNHPDVVLGEVRPGEPTLPDGRSTEEPRNTMPLDWLRSERRRGMEGGAKNTTPKNRPFQYDHYQINQHWQDLAVVLQDQEIGAVYTPRVADTAVPFKNTNELISVLTEDLAPLEMALAFEYLYTCFTVRDAREADTKWPTMANDVVFIRHYLLLTAQSEMLHLRWVNELLWELFDSSGRAKEYKPILHPASKIPGIKGSRPPVLQRFTPEAIDEYVFMEDPNGYIDSTYGRVIATLRQPGYPPHLADLAIRIATDGVEHFSRFKDMQKIVKTYQGSTPANPYLRDVKPGTEVEAHDALDLLKEILKDLADGYSSDAKGRPKESGGRIARARAMMLQLYDEADRLARVKGIGVPFFSA